MRYHWQCGDCTWGGREAIGDAGRTLEGVDKGSDTVEGTRHTMVGETGKCDKTGVLRGAPPILALKWTMIVLLPKGGGGGKEGYG